MNRRCIIRDAIESDLEAINRIYNHYVPISDCTMDMEPVPMEGRRNWFFEHGLELPIIVAEIDLRVVGWASISKHRPRPAYRYTVEDAVYVSEDEREKGLGSRLLDELIARSRDLKYHSMIAVINANHEASLQLHRNKGFVEVANLREVGYKLGKWVDIKYMQLML